MTYTPNPDLDLTISRIIRAPRADVWNAWTNPASLAHWWVPSPAKCRVDALELEPGGAFITRISEDGGHFHPHMNACILAVDPMERIVLTDTLIAGWRPSEKPFMTAIITFRDHPDGTDYVAHAMHKSGADRTAHDRMGFYDGWGTVVAQLAAFVER